MVGVVVGDVVVPNVVVIPDVDFIVLIVDVVIDVVGSVRPSDRSVSF